MTLDGSKRPFLVLATDGVWELLDSRLVAAEVAKALMTSTPGHAVRLLQAFKEGAQCSVLLAGKQPKIRTLEVRKQTSCGECGPSSGKLLIHLVSSTTLIS